MTYLTLEWENDYPVHCRDQLTLTEFSLVGEPIASEGHDNFDFDKDASGDFRKLIFLRKPYQILNPRRLILAQKD